MYKRQLFVIDVDNFKAVNDNLGHLFGDAVLSEISSKITSQFRSSDIVGRIGGDEFVVFLKNLRSTDPVSYTHLNSHPKKEGLGTTLAVTQKCPSSTGLR